MKERLSKLEEKLDELDASLRTKQTELMHLEVDKMRSMEAVLQQKVIEVASHVEQLDAELEKLDNLDINDYEKIRAHRLNELKRMQK